MRKKVKDRLARERAAAKARTAGVDVAAALKVRRLPDPVKAGKLRDMAAAPAVTLGGPASSTFTEAVATKTPDQRAIEACGAWYGRLTVESPRTIRAVAAMIALRRMYAVAYREVTDAVDQVQAGLDEAGGGEEVPPELSDFCAHYAMYAASRPFDEHALMQSVADTLLPWLADVVDKHALSDHHAAVEERARRTDERLASVVPIGFKHTPTQEQPGLSRDKSLVLIGWRNAVMWLFDKAADAVLAAEGEPLTVVRLMTKAPRVKEQQARLVRLAPSAWNGCANSDRDIDGMVALFVQPAAGGPVDLVMVDDMSVAHTRGFVGRPAAAQAADAQRRLRKWCDVMQAALLGAVPLDSCEPPDTAGPEFEQLRTFSMLRPVHVRDDQDGHYLVTVGGAAAVFRVPKATLDGYGSTLVAPDAAVQ